ncbi:hypothetical protein [Leptolyngbya sp. FACHB-711]|uniref:hypothetical protein n=1 Tax=unclassified Leptolyngbya TaxID=2650499 RepID=UPI00168648A5|nr:hypothetical protein [Leptolyngbya sp. FACHB-711]MBD1848522.1 hypothetical protein [Cyanobacteria bacterium FACHB-502]MBD2025069.1 hypothetical protein [Leptolyngbya sp. FACHB-711]
MTFYPRIIPTENPLRPLAARPTREVKPRLWLLVLATCSTLTFGYRPQEPLLATLMWAIRLGGAACAVAALYRDPEIEIYDPIAEEKALHEFQMARLQAAHQAALQQKQWEIQQYYDALTTQQIQQTIDHYAALLQQKEYELLQLKQGLANQQVEFETEKQRLTQSWQSQWDRLEIQTAELEVMKNQLKAERDAIYAWAEEKAAELDAAERDAREQLSARAAKLEKDLDNQRNLLIEEFEKQHNALVGACQKEIENYKRLIADMEATIESQRLYLYNLQQPELINGSTTYELLADRVIQFLYNHGVIVRDPRIVPFTKKFQLSFNILPIVPGKNDKGKYAENLIDAYKRIHDRLLEGIMAEVPNCKTKPGLEMSNRRIVLTIDISGVDWEAENQVDPIVEADPDWPLTIVRIANHFRVTGNTDTDKSTLVDNLVGAMQQVWVELRLSVADPKYPFTEWSTFTPNYKGVEESFRGVSALEQIVDSRFRLARKAKEAGKPLPEFAPELFVLDEAEILMDEARAIDEANPPERGKISLQKHLTRMLRKGLKLGRGLTKQRGKGLKVAYIAQSPLCSRLGMNRDDFDQSVNIFIGENIPRALEEELKTKISNADKAFWKEQYHLRVERGDQYFCLVKAPGLRPFIATMPPPGHYALGAIETVALAVPASSQEEEVLELEAFDEDEEDIDEDIDEDIPVDDDGEAIAEELDEQRDRLEERFNLPDLTQLPERGLELLGYVYGKGNRYADAEGWFVVAKLRDNWGKDRNIDTAALKILLHQLNDLGIGEFRARPDENPEAFWRPRIDPRFLPRNEE